MLWRVMEHNAPQQRLGGRGSEHFFEGFPKMRVEVVQNQVNLFTEAQVCSSNHYTNRAKSDFVRRSVTLTTRRPALGSTAAKMLHVPSRAYT
mgnify:CR=1 FL=1